MKFELVRLGDYFLLEKGASYTSANLVDESDVGLLTINAFTLGGGYKPNSEKPFSGHIKEQYILSEGDVLLAMTEQDSGLLASPLVVKIDQTNFRSLLFSLDVAKVSSVNEELSTRFLFNVLRIPAFRKRAAYGDTGSTVQRLPYEALYDLRIPKPPLRVQEAIVQLIDSIDEKIRINGQIVSHFERIAQTIFKSWFIDFDPVKAKMEGEKPSSMPDETASLFPDSLEESDFGLVPKGWRFGTLGEILSALESGKRPRGGAQDKGIPSIGAESVRGIGHFNYAATKYIPIDFYAGMPTGKVQSFDVLVYKDGAGAGSFVTMFGEGFPFEEFAINEHVFLLRSTDVPQSFLYHWLSQDAQKKLMIQLAQKSAQPGLNQQDTKSIPILIPSTEILTAFSNLIDPMMQVIMWNSKQGNSLSSIRDSLLPRLVSGELEIPEELLAS